MFLSPASPQAHLLKVSSSTPPCMSRSPPLYTNPHHVLIPVLCSPSNTTLTLPFPWRIPNTSISLQLRLGRPVHPDVLLQLLLLVDDEVRDEILLRGGDTPLPKEGYDCDYDELDFSAYSPLEPGHPNTMTWGLLSTIIKGLSIYLHDQLRNREAFFKVLNGPGNVFVGYGHLILGRKGVAVD